MRLDKSRTRTADKMAMAKTSDLDTMLARLEGSRTEKGQPLIERRG